MTILISKSTASYPKFLTGFLIAIIILQWLMFSILLNQRSNQHRQPLSLLDGASRERNPQGAGQSTTILSDTSGPENDKQHDSSLEMRIEKVSPLHEQNSTTKKWAGVAVTILFRAPKWMHLRYNAMIDNALLNIPEDWAVQVFVNAPWAEQDLFPWHPGLQRRLQNHPRLIRTDLPPDLIQPRAKPKQVLLSTWFWKAVMADTVLLFSGNGAFCGNHLLLPNATVASLARTDHDRTTDTIFWKQLMEYDYCGSPNGRAGGDGSTHSIRNRPAMLRVLEHHQAQGASNKVDSESHFFLETMQRMNRESDQMFRICTEEQTQHFGGVHNLSQSTRLRRLPLVVSGTQARLSYADRDSLLKHCPEVKIIFPSLHEPTCFGAHPQGETCKASICALQEHIPPHGC